MEIKFRKTDLFLALLGGELVAWLFLPTLKNISVLDGIIRKSGLNFYYFSAFWAIFVPIMALIGLYFFYLIARKKNQTGFFEMGKYGVIGVLNTALNTGVYNFFIFTTNISSGLMVDAFFVIAFIITVINSFFWNKYWTFEEKGNRPIKNEAFNFFAVSTVTAVINTAIIHFTVTTIGAPQGIDPKIWANVGLIFAIIVAFFGNFFGYKFIVFKK